VHIDGQHKEFQKVFFSFFCLFGFATIKEVLDAEATMQPLWRCFKGIPENHAHQQPPQV
jgi:hypothetical protein